MGSPTISCEWPTPMEASKLMRKSIPYSQFAMLCVIASLGCGQQPGQSRGDHPQIHVAPLRRASPSAGVVVQVEAFHERFLRHVLTTEGSGRDVDVTILRVLSAEDMIAPELWVFQEHPAPDTPLWRGVSTKHTVCIDMLQFMAGEWRGEWSRWGPSTAVTVLERAAVPAEEAGCPSE
jgi:hypothetical protein